MGGSSKPKPQPAPPPPAPPAAQESAEEYRSIIGRRDMADRQVRRRGRSSTILSDRSGNIGAFLTGTKTLLGE